MLTLMFELELSKSGRSFFRSAIDGLSTAASVIVVAPPPPPPPAPEHAPATSATTMPRTRVTTYFDVAWCRSGGRRSLSLIRSNPLLGGPDGRTWPKSGLSLLVGSDKRSMQTIVRIRCHLVKARLGA